MPGCALGQSFDTNGSAYGSSRTMSEDAGMPMMTCRPDNRQVGGLGALEEGAGIDADVTKTAQGR
jgi:hypothetical protein